MVAITSPVPTTRQKTTIASSARSGRSGVTSLLRRSIPIGRNSITCAVPARHGEPSTAQPIVTPTFDLLARRRDALIHCVLQPSRRRSPRSGARARAPCRRARGDGARSKILQALQRCIRSLANFADGFPSHGCYRVPDPRRKSGVFDGRVVRKLWRRILNCWMNVDSPDGAKRAVLKAA